MNAPPRWRATPRLAVIRAPTRSRHGEINTLLRKATYSSHDRERILGLLEALGLRQDDDGEEFALLRQNRGQLVRRRQNGDVEIVASGRADWVGWVELKSEPVDEQTTRNTARVIFEVDTDILGVVEAETRGSLRDFSPVMLRRVGGQPYAQSMLIEGNDDRGINVGVMTKIGFEIELASTHIFDLGPNHTPIFSRDCVEYLVRTRATTRSWCSSTTSKASAVAATHVAGGDRVRAAAPSATRLLALWADRPPAADP